MNDENKTITKRTICLLVIVGVMTACSAKEVSSEQSRARESRTPSPVVTPLAISQDQALQEIAKMERTENALRSLIDAKRRCMRAALRKNRSATEVNIACGASQRMVEQTPLKDLLGMFDKDITGLDSYAEPKFKHAIVEAAYTGYKYGRGVAP